MLAYIVQAHHAEVFSDSGERVAVAGHTLADSHICAVVEVRKPSCTACMISRKVRSEDEDGLFCLRFCDSVKHGAYDIFRLQAEFIGYGVCHPNDFEQLLRGSLHCSNSSPTIMQSLEQYQKPSLPTKFSPIPS